MADQIDLDMLERTAVRLTTRERELIAELRSCRARITGLVELCRDMLPYVPDYFREKWDYDAELAKLSGGQSDG